MAELPASFQVVADRSAILIRARSTVGPIEFGTTRLEGRVEALISGDRLVSNDSVAARLQVQVESLTSGNALYDAELLRRVDARKFPLAVVQLDQAHALGTEDRVQVRGRLTFHGVTRELDGVVSVSLPSPTLLTVTGEQVIDIRDFEIASPTMLMLKIYPDVQVSLYIEAVSKPT